jgi:hypothetical protein
VLNASNCRGILKRVKVYEGRHGKLYSRVEEILAEEECEEGYR